jgi:hypothetical protein
MPTLAEHAASETARAVDSTGSEACLASRHGHHLRVTRYLKLTGELPMDWHPSWVSGQIGAEWYGLKPEDESIVRGISYWDAVHAQQLRNLANVRLVMHAEGIVDHDGSLLQAWATLQAARS